MANVKKSRESLLEKYKQIIAIVYNIYIYTTCIDLSEEQL